MSSVPTQDPLHWIQPPQAFYHVALAHPNQLRFPKPSQSHLSLSFMSLLRPRIQKVYCGFMPLLTPGSLVLSPSGMTLLVLQGCPQHKPLQGLSPHLLRQDCSPSVCPRHLPKGSLTGFIPGKREYCSVRRLGGHQLISVQSSCLLVLQDSVQRQSPQELCCVLHIH